MISFAPSRWLSVALLTLVAGIAHADPSPAPAVAGVRTMRLADALAYAKAHQPQVIAAEARVAAARADAQVPRAEWLPVLMQTEGRDLGRTAADLERALKADPRRATSISTSSAKSS